MEKEYKRAKMVSLKAVVEYSDGTQKSVDIDVNENEALFWSDRAVLEMLAPFYNTRRQYQEGDLDELSKDVGEKLTTVTPEVVEKLWNISVDGTEEGDRPILIKKPIKCQPTVACKRCPQ